MLPAMRTTSEIESWMMGSHRLLSLSRIYLPLSFSKTSFLLLLVNLLPCKCPSILQTAMSSFSKFIWQIYFEIWIYILHGKKKCRAMKLILVVSDWWLKRAFNTKAIPLKIVIKQSSVHIQMEKRLYQKRKKKTKKTAKKTSRIFVSIFTWHDDLVTGYTLGWELITVAVIAEQGVILAGEGLVCQWAVAAETAEAVLVIMAILIKELLAAEQIDRTMIHKAILYIIRYKYITEKKTLAIIVRGRILHQQLVTTKAKIGDGLIWVKLTSFTHASIKNELTQKGALPCLQGTEPRKCWLYLATTACEGVDNS